VDGARQCGSDTAFVHRLEREQIIRRPRSQVFAFFSQARNLERLTPGFLKFRILTEDPIVMQTGALIDYQIRLFGVPMHWRTRIERFEPETYFVAEHDCRRARFSGSKKPRVSKVARRSRTNRAKRRRMG
jgi:hypothetical protein